MYSVLPIRSFFQRESHEPLPTAARRAVNDSHPYLCLTISAILKQTSYHCRHLEKHLKISSFEILSKDQRLYALSFPNSINQHQHHRLHYLYIKDKARRVDFLRLHFYIGIWPLKLHCNTTVQINLPRRRLHPCSRHCGPNCPSFILDTRLMNDNRDRSSSPYWFMLRAVMNSVIFGRLDK